MPQSQARALANLAGLPAPIARDRIWPIRQPKLMPMMVSDHGFGAVVANAATSAIPQRDAIPIFHKVAQVLLMAPNYLIDRPGSGYTS
jgi:hypothetical protein